MPQLSPGLQPPAVQPCVFQGDRKPEAGAPGGPCSRRVSPPEPVEDQLLLAGTQAHAEVPDGHCDRGRVHPDGYHSVLVFAMLYRVEQQVAQDALDPAAIKLGNARLSRNPEIDVRAAALRQLLRDVR
jgi:hypothetical protein